MVRPPLASRAGAGDAARWSPSARGRSTAGSGVFTPILDTLVEHGDHYMHLADLTHYVPAQELANALYRQPVGVRQKAILQHSVLRPISNDRTIAEYAAEIWNVEPFHVI